MESCWYPNTQKIHSGKTRSCDTCHEKLLISWASSWDVYFVSSTFLESYQENINSDDFCRSLICNLTVSGGDIPTEYCLTQEKKQKLKSQIDDSRTVTSAGIVEEKLKHKTTIRQLEELWLTGQSTPTFLEVMERRMAVMHHVSLKLSHHTNYPHDYQGVKPTAGPALQLQFHHMAIGALGILIRNQKIKSDQRLHDVLRLLTRFEKLSLFNYWCPSTEIPESFITNNRQLCINCSSTLDSHVAENMLNLDKTTFWSSIPGENNVVIDLLLQKSVPNAHQELELSSITIIWKKSFRSDRILIQYESKDNNYLTIIDRKGQNENCDYSSAPSFENRYRLQQYNDKPLRTSKLRIILQAGAKEIQEEKDYCFAIENIRIATASGSRLYSNPKRMVNAVEDWLFSSLEGQRPSSDIEIGTIEAMKSWALSTGALSSCLKFAQILKAVSTSMDDSFQQRLQCIASDFISELRSFRERQELLAKKTDVHKRGASASVIQGRFDPSICSSGTIIDNQGRTIKTREASYQHGVINIGVSSGYALWEFKLEHDTLEDEMTCFGAATIPISVSSYDSSPNLWMLCGYNGNLYARGRKLPTTFAKVHPGDIVRVQLNMELGTLSYAINGIDQGVAFNDLKGLEVHPAVSFYGTGKTISLQSLETWGSTATLVEQSVNSGNHEEKLYLSNLNEYEFSVGYGSLGRGSTLGYEPNAHIGLSSENDSDSASGLQIRVSNEYKHRSLSTHPPLNGIASVVYDLSRKYTTFNGSCALNDDISSESMASHGTKLCFSIWGDGDCLWTSERLTKKGVTIPFSINVCRVQMLELQVHCNGPNNEAHAIWVDPHLLYYGPWLCTDCNFLNSGTKLSCNLCNSDCPRMRKSCQPESDEVVNNEFTGTIPVQDEIPRQLVMSFFNELVLGAKALLPSKEGLTVEQPFFIEPSAETFSTLYSMLEEFSERLKIGTAVDYSFQICIQLLRMLQYNFARLHSCNISPLEVGIYHKEVCSSDHGLWSTAGLLKMLERFAGVNFNNLPSPIDQNGKPNPFPSLSSEASEKLRREAAQVLLKGFGVLYPTAEDRVHISLNLIRRHSSEKGYEDETLTFLVGGCIEELSRLGEYGIYSVVPSHYNSDYFASEASFNLANSVDELLTVTLELLSKTVFSTSCSNGAENKLKRPLECFLVQYQRQLVAEAVALLRHTSSADSFSLSRKKIQDNMLRYSQVLFSKCRIMLEHADAKLKSMQISQESAKTILGKQLQKSFVGKLLPQFSTALCLFRRQSWLPRPVLPSIVRLVCALDRVCSQITSATLSESRLQGLEFNLLRYGLERGEVLPPMRNVFHELYTGEKDHFDGQIGFHFEANSSFSIVALGRSVNKGHNDGLLVKSHAIRLWDELSESLLAEVSVDGNSPLDNLGYVYERLSAPIYIVKGCQYRITSYEYAQSGDPWYKREEQPDEEYDKGMIKILQDCYAASSCSFPNNQNLASAAYGVPSFWYEGSDSFSVPMLISPSFGASSIDFDSRSLPSCLVKSPSDGRISVLGNGEKWVTAVTQCSYLHGVHAIKFRIRSTKLGASLCQNLSVGVSVGTGLSKKSFLGSDSLGYGWMPSNGMLWNNSVSVKGYTDPQVLKDGDEICMIINCDESSISFSYNNKSFGIAFSPNCLAKCPEVSGPQLYPSVSLYGKDMSVEVLPAGYENTTLHLDWLHNTLKTVGSVASRLASTMMAGAPVDGIEEELRPWLESNLLSGGLLVPDSIKASASTCSDSAFTASNVDSWCNDWRTSVSLDLKRSPPINPDAFSLPCSIQDQSQEKHNPENEGEISQEILGKVIEWLDVTAPDKSVLRRSGCFPDCEKAMLAVLLRNSPKQLRIEAAAAAARNNVDKNICKSNPSCPMMKLWQSVLKLRHWLIKSKHEFNARSDSPKGHSHSNFGSLENTISPQIVMPKDFSTLLENVEARAKFLCALSPQSEEASQGVDSPSQIALSNLAAKWKSGQPPTLPEPMFDRWKTLPEYDTNFSSIVGVLRAQHNWKTKGTGKENSTLELESNDAYNSSFNAMIRACDLYIRNGMGAPPPVLKTLLGRREKRSESRVFGMKAFTTLLQVLTFNSAVHDAVVFLRPAFRGFTESEKESRAHTLPNNSTSGILNGSSPPIVRSTVRHHYFKGLEGCNKEVLKRVRSSFSELYGILHDKLEGCVRVSDLQLSRALLCAWSLDFEPEDHKFLLQSGIFNTLQSLFSVGDRCDRAMSLLDLGKVNENDSNKTKVFGCNSLLASQFWYPMSEDYVFQELALGGFVRKRDILYKIFSTPRNIISDKWLKDRFLTGSFDDILSSQTVSSMRILYKEYLKTIHEKNSYCYEAIYSKSLSLPQEKKQCLRFCHRRDLRDKSKTNLGYAETDAIGNFVEWTIEVWVFPTNLKGYGTIRSDNGFEDGSVHIEFVDSQIQVAIRGHVPREQRFSFEFCEIVWQHIAIVYSGSSIKLYVDGSLEAEELHYTCSPKPVMFRKARIGSWLPFGVPSGTPGPPCRPFEGCLAELRLWDCCRSATEVFTFYQRTVEPTQNLKGYWRLDGKGNRLDEASSNSCNEALDLGSSIESHHALLTNCEWLATSKLPLFGINVQPSATQWRRVVLIFRNLQRKFRTRLHYQRMVVKREVLKVMLHQDMYYHKAVGTAYQVDSDEEEDSFRKEGVNNPILGIKNLSFQTHGIKSGPNSSKWNDTNEFSRNRMGDCAWILFRFLSAVVMCGSQERRAVEANVASARAKKRRRKQQDISSRSDSVEVDKKENKAEEASAAARSAAMHSDLEAHALPTLWFSMELQRKVFEVLENELAYCAASIKEAEGLMRSQRPLMSRSMSTPSPGTMYTRKRHSSSLKGSALEPVELDELVHKNLLFMLSQSIIRPVQLFIIKPNMLKHLIMLLRLGSPRNQRLVLLLLRSVLHLLQPEMLQDVLGANTAFVELLLDRVAESVLGASSNLVAHYKYVDSSNLSATTESLSNPLGFQTGQLHLSIGSESVSMLRLLFNHASWESTVSEVLLTSISNAASLLSRYITENFEEYDSDDYSSGEEAGDESDQSLVRFHVAIQRAIASLSVLGAHTDCIRVGGKVRVVSHVEDSITALNPASARSRSLEGSSATIVQLDSASPNARVVFDGSYDDSDPVHNIQEVPILSMSPIEEVCLQTGAIKNLAGVLRKILVFASIPDSVSCRESERTLQAQLWRSQIKSRALLAQENLLRSLIDVQKCPNDFISMLVGGDPRNHRVDGSIYIPSQLLAPALEAINLKSFVGLPYLEERSRMILCRLIEVSTPIGPCMFQKLGDPTSPAGSIDSTGLRGNEVEESKECINRRQLAITLAAMGFEVELCIVALRKNRDNINLAIEWLMSPAAESFSSSGETYGDRDIEDAGRSSSLQKLEFKDILSSRLSKAIELETISGMPREFVWHVLEMFHENSDASLNWLMDYGSQYSENFDLLGDQIQATQVEALENAAALEDCTLSDPLLISDIDSTRHVDRKSKKRKDNKKDQIENEDRRSVRGPFEAELDYILAPKNPSPVSGSCIQWQPLDPSYLSKNVILTVSSEVGGVQRLSTAGLTGIVLNYCKERGVLIRFLNTETGVSQDDYYSPKELRRITKFYGCEVDDYTNIFSIAKTTEQALSTHYARRAIVALMTSWNPDTVNRSSVSAGGVNAIISAFGGPRRFVNFLKLSAAAERIFKSNDAETASISKERSIASGKPPEGSLMPALRVKMLEILQHEGSSIENSLYSSSSGIDRNSAAPVVENVLNDQVAVGELELAQAIESSLSDLVLEDSSKNGESYGDQPYSHGFLDRDTSFGMGSRERISSDAEAQEAAMLYMSGSDNDHDGLLSSVLVKECVSHFVESTTSSKSLSQHSNWMKELNIETGTYQSLHPYFHQCDYATHVFVRGSQALKVSFDSRCELGSNTTLIFYDDSEYKNEIFKGSGTEFSLKNFVVHNEEFWMRFISKEAKDKPTGYGYRFLVSTLPHINWLCEKEVLEKPSLEWACWILEFLLNDAKKLIPRGAVHNRQVFGALVRYLRSPGAPYKNRVISLLTQLLSQPEQFISTSIPDLNEIREICDLVFLKAEVEKTASKLILPRRLLQLLELSMTVYSFAEYFKENSHLSGESEMKKVYEKTHNMFEDESKVASTASGFALKDTMREAVDIMKFLLYENQLPPTIEKEILQTTWGKSCVIETSHPYDESSTLSGVISFQDAVIMKVWFDPRCALGMEGETKLRLCSHAPGSVKSSDEKVYDKIFNAESTNGSGWPNTTIVIPGNSVYYRFTGSSNPEGLFGIAFTVIAYSPDGVRMKPYATEEKKLLETINSDWTAAMDSQLVDWVNSEVEASMQGAQHSGIKSIELSPAQLRLRPSLDALKCNLIIGMPLSSLQLRHGILLSLNQKLSNCLEMFDLKESERCWTNAFLIRRLANCIFFDLKNLIVEAGIEKTWFVPDAGGGHSSSPRITLDRIRALESREEQQIEPSVSECFFAQAFRQLHAVNSKHFCKKIDNKGRLFSVKFKGEEGVDWGGVYRDGANSIVDDLFSLHFNLFLLCPNGQHDIGSNRGMYLPNPMCTSPVAIQMYEFAGKLIGISFRTRADFPFFFPSLVWKQFIGQPLNTSDLEATDAMVLQMIEGIRACEKDGIDDEEKFKLAFSDLDLRFMASGSNGSTVELEQGGQDREVTFKNRIEYCDLLIRHRLYEFSLQIEAMLRGISTVMPLRILKLLTWQEMELLTCGSPKIDINIWKKNTKYDGYNETDETVKLFWNVLESFTDEQRTDFVRFAWGRSRLPRGRWPQPFKLTKKGGRESTKNLPVAHTCFFSVELPPYTTEDHMRHMLVATINFGLGGILMA